MYVERKTGGMAKEASRIRYGDEATNQAVGYRSQVSVNSQEQSPTETKNVWSQLLTSASVSVCSDA
jgi:hypothetical protein